MRMKLRGAHLSIVNAAEDRNSEYNAAEDRNSEYAINASC